MNEFELLDRIAQTWKKVERQKALNQELYNLLGDSLFFIMRYSEKHAIPLPNKTSLYEMVSRIHNIMDNIDAPTENQQPNTTPEDSTQPQLWYC